MFGHLFLQELTGYHDTPGPEAGSVPLGSETYPEGHGSLQLKTCVQHVPRHVK